MSRDKSNSGTPHLSTDDLLSDYLNDMFGETPVPDRHDEPPLDLHDNTLNMSIHDSLVNSDRIEEHQKTESNVARVETEEAGAVLDVFGGHRVSALEAISSDFSLIPTIKLIKSPDDQTYRSQCEAQIILLTFLFYLRKPLSPRVRQTFLDYSEQAIDDYYAAFWLNESARESLQ